MSRRPSPLLVLACGLALGGAAMVGVHLARGTGHPSPAASAPPVTEGTAPPEHAPPAVDLRPAIRARVAAVLAEQRRGHELDVYLNELERTARAQGHVSALEVVPGLAAIEAAFPGDTERGAAFSRAMEKLQRDLGQPGADTSELPAGVTTASVLQAISQAPPGPERDKLIPKALVAIGRLPESEQEEASRALDRATATPGTAPIPVEPDRLD